MNTPNLRMLEPSRKPPRPGDIFVVLPPDGLYLFGRVIATDAEVGTGSGLLLLYFFNVRSPTPVEPDPELLTPGHLLMPPEITNAMGWRHGYFKTIAHRELKPSEVLPVHCFRDPDASGMFGGGYYDEHNRKLKMPHRPVGMHAVGSYRTIDDGLSQALGIPLAPD
jgi:hypothetical protein